MNDLLGFCIDCKDDVPISSDGRCLASRSLVIAPSTGCNHMRFRGGGWTACTNERPCKPIAPGTWQTPLNQTKSPRLTRSESLQNHAARRFSGGAVAVPKLASAHKPAKAPRQAAQPSPERRVAPVRRRPRKPGRPPSKVLTMGERGMPACTSCGRADRVYGGRGYCDACRKRERERARGARPQETLRLREIPCPICGTPFRPYVIGGADKRKKTCSLTCGAVYHARLKLTQHGKEVPPGYLPRQGVYSGPEGSWPPCVQCGRTDRQHKTSGGLCVMCWRRGRRQEVAS
jgi:hypothetical protein